jgi:peroxiredoxin family protein
VYTKITTSKLNWTETHTILPIFLGSMQEAHMCASCVLPSVASLTGRSVCVHTYFHGLKVLRKKNTTYVVFSVGKNP